MKSILFICPYFGKLPTGQMELWLHSCEKNPSINWLIITDDKTKFSHPENVEVIITTLHELKERVQTLFPFPISLENPYKLCDYKPCYGYMFSDYVEGYDYWGHCDMTDCIFGNLRKFLTDSFLEDADKFLFLGHMTIYRNTEKVNRRVFNDVTARTNNLRNILGKPQNFAFDETNPTSINTIYAEQGYKLKRLDDMYVDISSLFRTFVSSKYDQNFKNYRDESKRVFEWNNGALYECKLVGNYIQKTEIGYVHYQKRRMKIQITTPSHYYIIPNKFIDASFSLTPEFIKKANQYKYLYPNYFKLRYRNLKFKIKRRLGMIG